MKPVLANLSEVPEALRGEYTERDGKFYLKVDDAVILSPAEVAERDRKLNEFRDNNRKLNESVKERDDKLKLFDGVDPEEYRKLKDGQKPPEGIEAIVAAAVAKANKPLHAQVEQLTADKKKSDEDAAKAKKDLADKELEGLIRDAAIKFGVEDTAVEDFVARGKRLFSLDNGKPVARREGEDVYSKRDRSQLLTLAEWAEDQQVEAPHLFKPSRGGGADTRGGGGKPTKKIIVNGDDPLDVGRHLEEIAKGDAIVRRA